MKFKALSFMIALSYNVAFAENRVENPVLAEKVEKSIESGVLYLIQQQKKNGAWENNTGYLLNDNYRSTGEGDHVGVSSIAGLAIMASGLFSPGGKFSKNVKSAQSFVRKCIDPETFFIKLRDTRMYSHAFASMFLLECFKSNFGNKNKKEIENVAWFTKNSAGESGGWGYLPLSSQTHTTITACQLLFLQTAKSIGFESLDGEISQGEKYIRRCRNTKVNCIHERHLGSYRYGEENMNRFNFGTTASSIAVSLTASEENKIETAKYLLRNWPEYNYESTNLAYFFSHFFASVFYLKMEIERKDYFNKIKRELLILQRDEGYWIDDVGPNYATAMAILILSAEKGKLLIFK